LHQIGPSDDIPEQPVRGGDNHDTRRSLFLAAGEAIPVAFQGPVFGVYYVLSAIALLIIAGVILQRRIFSNATAYLGLFTDERMVTPSPTGTIGLTVAIASPCPRRSLGVDGLKAVSARLGRLS
jgi:hypothetical protein